MRVEQSTITAKGQVTIPKRVRERLHLAAGDRIEWSIGEDDSLRVRKVTAGHWSGLVGMVPRFQDSPLTTDQIDETIAGHVTFDLE